jgi:hypothetical protein
MMNMLKIVMKTLLIVLQDYLMFVLEEQFMFAGASSLTKNILLEIWSPVHVLFI